MIKALQATQTQAQAQFGTKLVNVRPYATNYGKLLPKSYIMKNNNNNNIITNHALVKKAFTNHTCVIYTEKEANYYISEVIKLCSELNINIPSAIYQYKDFNFIGSDKVVAISNQTHKPFYQHMLINNQFLPSHLNINAGLDLKGNPRYICYNFFFYDCFEKSLFPAPLPPVIADKQYIYQAQHEFSTILRKTLTKPVMEPIDDYTF